MTDTTPAPAPPATRKPSNRPALGLLIVATIGFRFFRELVQRLAGSRYGIVGFFGVALVGLALLALWRWDQRRRAARRCGEFTPESVVAQVEQSGLVGPVFDEDGTLLGSSLVVVNQIPKLIEVNTAYEVLDDTGATVGQVAQVGQSRAKQVVRYLLPIDQFLTHRLEIRDRDGIVVLRLLRPAKLFRTRVHVSDAAGRELGTIRQRNIFWRIHFDLEDATGALLGSLQAENVRAWDFRILDDAGHVIARIVKTWEGWTKAAATRADHFVVRIERQLDEPVRSLVFASALAVDLALKQDNRR